MPKRHHSHWSPHEDAHRQSEALVRDGLLERVVRTDGRIGYRAITRKPSS